MGGGEGDVDDGDDDDGCTAGCKVDFTFSGAAGLTSLLPAGTLAVSTAHEESEEEEEAEEEEEEEEKEGEEAVPCALVTGVSADSELSDGAATAAADAIDVADVTADAAAADHGLRTCADDVDGDGGIAAGVDVDDDAAAVDSVDDGADADAKDEADDDGDTGCFVANDEEDGMKTEAEAFKVAAGRVAAEPRPLAHTELLGKPAATGAVAGAVKLATALGPCAAS